MDVSETSHHSQPLTGMFPNFHSGSEHWYPIVLDLSPLTFFFSYKKCPVLSFANRGNDLIRGQGWDSGCQQPSHWNDHPCPG